MLFVVDPGVKRLVAYEAIPGPDGGLRLLGARKIEYDLGNEYVAHLAKLHPSFYNEYSTGDLLARATNDIAAVRMVCGPAIMYMTNTVVTGTGALVLMFSIHPGLTLFALLPLPLACTITRQACPQGLWRGAVTGRHPEAGKPNRTTNTSENLQSHA